MKNVVTGTNGFVSLQLVQRLLSSRTQVMATVRSEAATTVVQQGVESGSSTALSARPSGVRLSAMLTPVFILRHACT